MIWKNIFLLMIGNNAAVHRMLKEEQIDITATTYTATDCSASDIYSSINKTGTNR
jgi:hypothetical protein